MQPDTLMLPMPELQPPPVREFTVGWRTTGTLIVFAADAAEAARKAQALSVQRLALLSETDLKLDEPKEVGGE